MKSVDTTETVQRDMPAAASPAREEVPVGSSEAQQSSRDDVYITTGAAARMLRVSPKTVSRWAKDGRIPHIVTLGGHRRFPLSAIEDLATRLQVVG